MLSTHCAAATVALLLGLSAGAEAKPKKLDPDVARIAGASVDKGIEFLRKVQRADGSFAEADNGPAITGLVLAGVLRTGRVTVTDPLVAKGLQYLEKHVQPDGGIYSTGGQKNYPTAIAVMAFASANKDGRYRSIIDKAAAMLAREQWDETEKTGPESPKFGGAGYGSKSRPDLSNTAFLLEAIDSAGLPKDHPAYQRALVFVRRCQNLTGEGANDLPQGALVNDGGFYYTPAEDYNPGGGTAAKGLRSYGSMTYAGLKSFIHAGVKKDDPRVKAAIGWIRKHYTLKENPGVGQEGLFYYYHTFAKAMDMLEVDQFEDSTGKKHDWRADLVRTLAEKQRPDGSWANPNKRWFESDPRLVTAYALLALGHVMD